MPLVKGGKITEDPFVHAVDGAQLPAEGSVLLSAAGAIVVGLLLLASQYWN